MVTFFLPVVRSVEEWAQDQSSVHLIRVETALELESRAFAEIALEDVAVMAHGREDPALPLLVETRLRSGDRHRARAARVPVRFRPLAADQRPDRPCDDESPLPVVRAGRSNQRERGRRFRQDPALETVHTGIEPVLRERRELAGDGVAVRSEEHTSELQSL